MNILGSNFLMALVTLVVGAFAIGLYLRQKADYKRDAALLIRQEIRHAEQQVTNARSFSHDGSNYPLSIKLLPTNSWYKNIHLFVNDFEQPQIDAISRFYAQVEYMDSIIEKISDYKASIIEQKFVTPQGKEIASEAILPKQVYLSMIARSLIFRTGGGDNRGVGVDLAQTVNTGINETVSNNINVTVVNQLVATNILKEISAKVEFIYNTPIGEKFKDISKQKLFFIF